MKEQKVNILGTKYKIVKHKTREDDERFNKYDGWCDTSIKEIHIVDNIEGDKKSLQYVKDKILRHEIIHAFMYEAGKM